MRHVTKAADARAQREADAAAVSTGFLHHVAPEVVALLHEAPDTVALSRVVGLLMQGIAQVAQAQYAALAATTTGSDPTVAALDQGRRVAAAEGAAER